MATNARSWFYGEPENTPYLVTERLNSTFWSQQITGVYWRCDRAETPFHATGYLNDHTVEMEWQPGAWLALKAPFDVEVDWLAQAISSSILGFPATLAYDDTGQDRRVVEWHTDGGGRRWNAIQGVPRFENLARLDTQGVKVK